VTSLTWFIIRGVFSAVGSITSIREAIFWNKINVITLVLIQDEAGKLAKFLLDLLEVAKCY
jgi:hypothetical protein